MSTTKVNTPDQQNWSEKQLLDSVLVLMKEAATTGHYGPFVLVMSYSWKHVLKRVYRLGVIPRLSDSSQTIKERLLSIEGIAGICFTNSLMPWGISLAETVIEAEARMEDKDP